MQRGVGKRHPARRMARGFGYSALAGLALLVLSIPIGLLMNFVEDGHESPVFVVPLILGVFLTIVGWIMWGSWSATLDRYSEPLGTTAKLTLAATAAIVLGVLCFLLAAAPLAVYTDTDPPDDLLPVAIVLCGLGILLVAGTLVGSAVYGGIALGGPRWWWVGVLLSGGLIGAATGLALGQVALTVLCVAALVVSCFGYRWALVSGLRQRRPDAVEAEGWRSGSG
ncbi:hypothetical protein DFP74_6584 [Nocardiopsis sp. Huas11]|uniref:hypothetical protein n=1 Tax=Nocardiopsis sp. Huas11 TaxID=2183912 RepID=UPI000F0FBF0A|nr:hypothetical protein [Nocardiopsis sp. Huas11]RKS10802.1 hypothetical protein DFP74_6584 [Nocardiopsis sp. Huas11]